MAQSDRMSPDNNPQGRGFSFGEFPREMLGKVRHIGRMPVLIASGLLGVILLVWVIGMSSGSTPHQEQEETKRSDSKLPVAADASAGIDAARATAAVLPPLPPTHATPLTELAQAATQVGSNRERSPAEVADDEAIRRAREANQSAMSRRRQAEISALDAETNVSAKGGGGPVGLSGSASAGGNAMRAASSGFNPAAAVAEVVAANGGMAAPGGMPQSFTGQDQNAFAEKAAFAGQTTRRPAYLAEGRIKPLSPYELKAGAVIPIVLLTGINSELPGEILGQVAENVRDTATGRFVLVPQGTRVVGRYDFQVAYGQERVQVVWNRLIYPDGSSLDLEGMPGADQAGQSGFADQVDHHYMRLFGSALFVSAFSAGIQLSQPQTASSGQVLTPPQVATASLGQQMGELGTELARKNMNIAPTITIRAGYRGEILTTRDVIISPWRQRP